MDDQTITAAQLRPQLRALRRAQKITQSQLGLRVGLSQSRVGKIERDPARVSVGEFLRILTALNVLVVLRAPATPPIGLTSEDNEQ